MIDAVYQSGIDIAFSGLGKQHPARACLQMTFGLGAVGKRAAAFHDQIDIQTLPRQGIQVTGLTDSNPVAVHQQIAAGFLYFDRSQKASVGTVIAGQMGQRLNVGKVVDRDDLQARVIGGFIQRAQD